MELHLIPLEQEQGDRYILYRPLLRLAFIGNRSMARMALRYGNSPPAVEELQRQDALHFLGQIGFFEPDPPSPKIQTNLSHTILLLTNRSQMRCSYCHTTAGEALPQKLSLEAGKVAIDRVHEQAAKDNRAEYRIDFHGGGEPTIEWEMLQELVQYARNKPVHAKVSVTSNGIWSDAQARWLMGNLDSISVSMDGSPDTQDKQRPLRDQLPSSPIVMRNLKRLDESGYKYGIRMTACSPWHHLKEDVQYIVENTLCRSIHVEPAFNTQPNGHRLPNQEQATAFIQAFIDAYVVAKHSQASLAYPGARPKTITPTFCSAPFNALVINPEDQVVACYEIIDQYHPFADLATYGKIDGNKIILDHISQARFHTLLDERFSTCRDCFCHWTCAGDCFVRAFAQEPNGHLYKSMRCSINREITKYLLMDLIQENGGVWRGAPSDDEIALYE
jgi:uncharacterized protein